MAAKLLYPYFIVTSLRRLYIVISNGRCFKSALCLPERDTESSVTGASSPRAFVAYNLHCLGENESARHRCARSFARRTKQVHGLFERPARSESCILCATEYFHSMILVVQHLLPLDSLTGQGRMVLLML